MNGIYPTIQALRSISGVTSLVGQRIEPTIAPQGGELPCIVVAGITNSDEYLLGGPGKYPSARVRVECLARTATEAIGLGDAVIAGLDGLRGTFASMDVSSFLKGDLDATDSAEDFSTHRRMFDFDVRFSTSS